MSNQEQNNIPFKINYIDTLQFAILQETVNDKALSLSAGFAFGIDRDTKIVRCVYRYEFFSNDTPALIIETAMDFLIEENSFNNKIVKQNELIIPKAFATHLAMILVGTTRGILFEKTKGSVLNQLPMPTIDVTKSITSDVVINNIN